MCKKYIRMHTKQNQGIFLTVN